MYAQAERGNRLCAYRDQLSAPLTAAHNCASGVGVGDIVRSGAAAEAASCVPGCYRDRLSPGGGCRRQVRGRSWQRGELTPAEQAEQRVAGELQAAQDQRRVRVRPVELA